MGAWPLGTAPALGGVAEGPPFAKLFRVPSDMGGNVTRREPDGSPEVSGVWVGGGGAGV